MQRTAPAQAPSPGQPAEPAPQAPPAETKPGHNPCATFPDFRRDYCERLLNRPG
ncbi:hypothetical protein [Nonomuraea typhae]|uniref:Uncharacterized protein n=1 Tax=Nonomuraea typhae TaxID=2603600 RepID=A0ABW7YRC7_9ACTN